MPRHQTPAQRETIERVMHEFKHGELKTAAGKRKVKNPKQAIAIALHEAGASKYESPAENKRNLRRSKKKEPAAKPIATRPKGAAVAASRREAAMAAKKPRRTCTRAVDLPTGCC